LGRSAVARTRVRLSPEPGQSRYDNGWDRGGNYDRDGNQGGWQRNDDRRNDRWTSNDQRDRSNDQQRRNRRNVDDERYGSR
jgi:hypothetical protein